MFTLLLLTLGCSLPLIVQAKEPNIEKVQLKKRIVDVEITYPALNIPVSSKGFPINFEITIRNKGNKTIKGVVCILGTSNWEILGKEGKKCRNYTVDFDSFEVINLPGKDSVFLITPTIAEQTKEVQIKNCYIYEAEVEIHLCLSKDPNFKCRSKVHALTGPVEFANVQVLPATYDPEEKTYTVYITFDVVKREEGVIVDPNKIDITNERCPPYKPNLVKINIDVRSLIPGKKVEAKCYPLSIVDKGSGTCWIKIPESYLEGENYIYFPIRLSFKYGFETLDTIFLNLKPIRVRVLQ